MGAYRLNAEYSQLRLMPGCKNCGLPPTSCGLKVGPPSKPLGSRSGAHFQEDLRIADLNDDGLDDVINLQRTETALYTYLSNGLGDFAVGPRIELPVSRSSELAMYRQDGQVHFAVIDPDENVLLIVKVEPD